MKRAIISDVHANLEALRAVLADISRQEITAIYCLGDTIGYGPNPRECLDLVMAHCAVCLLGNHDEAVLYDPEGFSSAAERAARWTRKQLAPCSDDERSQARWDFLCRLPRFHRDGDRIFVHGSVRNPLSEYVFPEDVQDLRKMEGLFALIRRVAFQGHTHVAGIFSSQLRFVFPHEVPVGYPLGTEKVMINVGSVGQPRDGDARAAYVVYDDETVHFRRVPYAAQITADKIHAEQELDDFLGDRLLAGH